MWSRPSSTALSEPLRIRYSSTFSALYTMRQFLLDSLTRFHTFCITTGYSW